MAFDHVPLNWIRTFERTARLRSFQNAATELHVTPGAISQQIRKLELELGQPLFHRSQHPVSLTQAGQALFDKIERPLHQIEDALRESRNPNRGTQIHVWGSRFFMRLWLIPRMHLFNTVQPNLMLDLTTASPLAAVPEDCDIAIRVGYDMNPELHREPLLRRVAVPVCSPEYLRRNGPVSTIADYSRHHLLKGSLHDDEWRHWLTANGAGQLSLASVTTLSSSDLVHAAALEGVGIALGRLGFIEKEIAAGHLVQLCGRPSDVGDPFCLHYRRDRKSDPQIRAFVRWIREAVAQCSKDFPPDQMVLAG
jgi:LysR family glycine cleavage system transcriptional activator